MRKALLFGAVLLLLPGVLFAYAKPGNPAGFVNDYAQLFSASEKAQLEVKLSNYEKQSGNEIAVVSIKSLNGDTIENYAVSLFDDWNIGKKGKDNGILLLIAKDDREMRIEVGYGLEPELTDIEASHLIQNVLAPAFREEKYFDGVNNAADLIIQKLGGENSGAFEDQGDGSDWMGWIVVGVFGFLFLTRLFAQSRSWWLGGVIGGAAGLALTLLFGFFAVGLIAFVVLVPLGLFIDFIFSRIGPGGGPGGLPGLGKWGSGSWSTWNSSSSSSSSSGGGFGGFGGGSSGGGGASGGW
jgi:uncharacterized protein